MKFLALTDYDKGIVIEADTLDMAVNKLKQKGYDYQEIKIIEVDIDGLGSSTALIKNNETKQTIYTAVASLTNVSDSLLKLVDTDKPTNQIKESSQKSDTGIKQQETLYNVGGSAYIKEELNTPNACHIM